MTGTTLVYSGRTTNWPVFTAATAGAVLLIVLGKPWDGPWPGMALVLVLVVALLGLGLGTSTNLRVTTGPQGVHVRCGVLGWPRFTYPRERITAAELVTVSLWKTWNWGVSWTWPGGWLFVLRSGPALRLTLTNGRRITVGVADPRAAAAALGFDLKR